MEELYGRKNDPVFSQRVRAGKKRTYFIDVRTTRNGDYYLTITESKRMLPRYDDERERFVKHKIFLYKEDFLKFASALNEAIDYVKEQMPDYDFEQFMRERAPAGQDNGDAAPEAFEADQLDIDKALDQALEDMASEEPASEQ